MNPSSALRIDAQGSDHALSDYNRSAFLLCLVLEVLSLEGFDVGVVIVVAEVGWWLSGSLVEGGGVLGEEEGGVLMGWWMDRRRRRKNETVGGYLRGEVEHRGSRVELDGGARKLAEMRMDWVDGE